MAKLSLNELKSLVNGIITKAKISNASFSETRDNVVGLLDKIGKITTIDSVFSIDKLAKFDGEYLSFGKTVEDWYQDLILPTAYDSTGAGALSPSDPTYRPVYYSYTVGREKIKTSIRNDNIERAVHNDGQLGELVAMQYKRLEDSMAQYRYQLKKEMIAKFYDLCDDTLPANITKTYATGTAYNVGELVKSSNEGAIVVKAIANTNTKNWATAKADGLVIPLSLITSIAKPVDTSTGEAFIKQVKADVEVASDVSEGHSLNGNTIGAIEGLTLIVKQGVIPSLEVDTLAGAFNQDKLAMPVDIVVVNDFGSADASVYAALVDSRAMRLHPTYNAVRENFNGDGDFLNLFYHTENTAYISRNAFVKFYVQPSA